MNVALPALITFLVLLPGFIFRTGLKKVERTSLDFSPFGQVAAEAVLWALGAHLLWLFLSYVLFQHRFEPVVLMQLLSSNPAGQAEAAVAVGNAFDWIAAYFVSLIAGAYALPKLVRSAISRFRLDRQASPLSGVFRFHEAPWYYLLTGADFSREEAPDLIVISAIVEVAKEAILYVGVLDEFFVDAEGNLDRLVLQGVSRRPIASDRQHGAGEGEGLTDRFYEIEGDSFVLRYGETVTLNVQYVKLVEQGALP